MSQEENNGGMDQYLDQPIQLESDIADELIEFDTAFHSGVSPEPVQEELNPNSDDIDFGENGEAKPTAENPNPDDIDFDDEKAKPTEEEEDTFKAEEAIEKLKSLGFNVNKAGEEESPEQQKLNQIQEIDGVISNIKNFIQQDDLTLCRQKVVQDLTDKYNKEGRGSMLNSEEFKLEIEEGMDEYKFNQRLASLEARTIRSELEQYVSQKTNEKETLTKEIDEKKGQEIKNHRVELQNSFKGYNNKNLFGQKITPDTIKSAYNKITSGDFAKQVNSDKNIQAEFALFLELRDTINQSGGATYGEGVAAAVNAITGKNQHTTNTSLDKVVQNTPSGNALKDRYESWGNRTAVPEKQ